MMLFHHFMKMLTDIKKGKYHSYYLFPQNQLESQDMNWEQIKEVASCRFCVFEIIHILMNIY